MKAHQDLIGAGDALSKENWQEDVSCQEGVDALSETHVEEFEAVAVRLSRNTQNLDCWHKTGTERQSNRQGWHTAAAGEEIINAGVALPLLQGLEESDGHRHQQHGAKDCVVSQDEPWPGWFTSRLLHYFTLSPPWFLDVQVNSGFQVTVLSG